MKKVLLDIGFDFDFVLYGIVSEERPHSLAWHINNHLHYGFSRADDLVLEFSETEKLEVARFDYADEINHLSFNLFSNRHESEFWLPELKNIDYFLMVKGALESFRKRRFTEPFRSMQAIRIITEINHRKLKQKERLIF